MRAAARDWPFLATLVADVEMVLAKSDLDIAARYAELAGDAGSALVPARARGARAHGRARVLEIAEAARAARARPDARTRSIRLRNPYVDPMSFVQVDLLRRWRAGGRTDAALERVLVADRARHRPRDAQHGLSPGPALPNGRRGAILPRMRPPRLPLPLLVALAPALAAQELPLRFWGVRDGLAHPRADALYEDAKGWLWIGTWEGLSRFDGRRFASYGTRDGLPVALVNCIAQDPAGRLWVGTQGGGLAFLDEASEPRGADRRGRERPAFVAVRPDGPREAGNVSALFFDAGGALWCATEAGIYHASELGGASTRVEPVWLDPALHWDARALGELGGTVWMLSPGGLVGAGAAGIATSPWPDGAGGGETTAVEPLGGGRWIVSDERSVFELVAGGPEGPPWSWNRLAAPLPADALVYALASAPSGALWIGTTRGLTLWRDGHATTYDRANGLDDDQIRALHVDLDGDLWIATHLGGIGRLSAERVTSWVRGLPDSDVQRLVEAPDGRLWASTVRGGFAEIRDDGAVPVAGSERAPFATCAMRLACDRSGTFWIGTDGGLWRAPGPDLDVARARRLGPEDGFRSPGVFSQIREARDGSLWLAGTDSVVYRIDPGRARPPCASAVASGDGRFVSPPRLVWLDDAGTPWIAPFVGLWRARDGRWEPLDAAGPGEGELNPRDLFQDHLGRLWIGTRFRGLRVSDEPTATAPAFRSATTAEALASDAVWSIAEDRNGRLWLATARGLDRLDPLTGSVRHFGPDEGLAHEVVNHIIVDRRGDMWAATSGGVSRLDPRAGDEPRPPPRVWIERVSVAGEQVPLSPTGAARVGELVLGPGRSDVVIEYAGIDLRGARALRYQVRLDGVDGDWSRPMESASIDYARLAPGAYRFQVRALREGEAATSEPAMVALRFFRPCGGAVVRRLAPRGSRWSALGAPRTLASRARARAHAQPDRVRPARRAWRRARADRDPGGGRAARRCGTRRRGWPRSRACAHDARIRWASIVWADRPAQGPGWASSCGACGRRLATCSRREGVDVELRAPPEAVLERVGLAPDVAPSSPARRQGGADQRCAPRECSRVEIELVLDGNTLRLAIEDDGRGFDDTAGSMGHGLQSLGRRANALGARLSIRTGPGGGTRIELSMPISRPHVHAVAREDGGR